MSVTIVKPTRSTFKDLDGMKFNKLTVLQYAGTNKWQYAMWLCKCDCGTITTVQSYLLTIGKTKSCGCLKRESVRKRCVTHGHGNKQCRSYSIWCGIKKRCLNKRSVSFKDYGGRGIKICDRWRYSFMAFLEDMSEPPVGYSIDRINNDGDYTPENCKWSTQKEQTSNTRRSRFVTVHGATMTVMQAAEHYAIKPLIVYKRLNRGWSDHEAVFGRVK